MSRLATVLAGCCLALALPGCGADEPPDEETSMTPEQAYTALEEAVTGVLEAIAPDGVASLADRREVPCGGLGGNEFSKIKYTLEGGGGITDEATDDVLAVTRARVEEMGLTARTEREVSGAVTQGFEGGGFVGSLILDDRGGILVTGATDCLDNPER